MQGPKSLAVRELLVAGAVLLCLPLARAQLPEVATPSGGVVRGVRLEAAGGGLVDTFLGIPYAEPPVGVLRFRAPVPKQPWGAEVLDATRLPNSCWQVPDTMFPGFSGADEWNPNTDLSEDCLHLNVWVPSSAGGRSGSGSQNGLPVLVWIFGGGFVAGTPTLDMYDGRTLAAQGQVVVVSINYRLGALGFLYLEGAGDQAPGNMGLLDQVLALRWVSRNIASFGGDPNLVTIFGESAGACSVMFHLLSPISQPYFARAVIESIGSREVCYVSQSEARNLTHRLAGNLGCLGRRAGDHPGVEELPGEPVLECLRAAHASRIAQLQSDGVTDLLRFGFVPTTDGTFLKASPEEMIASHRFKRVPILLGSNTHEAAYWLIYWFPQLFPKREGVALSGQQLRQLVTEQVFYRKQPVIRDAILFEYGIDSSNQTETALAAGTGGVDNVRTADLVFGDYFFTCPTNGMGEAYSHAGQPVFMYRFQHRSSVNAWPKWTGVPHGYEIEYLFGRPLNRSLGFTDMERELTRRVIRYLTNFAKNGNPNGNNLAHWPQYIPATSQYLGIGLEGGQTGVGPRARQCAFWHHLIPKLEHDLAQSSSSCQANGSSSSRSSPSQTGVILFIFATLLSIVTR